MSISVVGKVSSKLLLRLARQEVIPFYPQQTSDNNNITYVLESTKWRNSHGKNQVKLFSPDFLSSLAKFANVLVVAAFEMVWHEALADVLEKGKVKHCWR